jgi:transposase
MRTEESNHNGSTNSAINTSLHPRLAWMLCYRETRSPKEVCLRFGISRKTFYKWLKRYRDSGDDASSLIDQSRRPHSFPRATPETSIMILKQLKDETGFGQRRLKIHLQEKFNISLSERTIWKILKRIDNVENGERTVSHNGASSSQGPFFPDRM